MPRPVFYFGAADTAPSENQTSDDGAVIVGAATPRRPLGPKEPLPRNEADWWFDYTYGRIFTSKHRLSAEQWSGFIYTLDRRFGGLAGFTLDAGAGGGGYFVKRAMMAETQNVNGARTKVVPICDRTIETQQQVAHARFLLNMFKRGDPGLESVWPDPNDAGKSLAGDELLKDAVFCAMKEAYTIGTLRLTMDADEYLATHKEQTMAWDQERIWSLKILTIGAKQMVNMVMETVEKDGMQVEVRTRRGARKFNSLGKDDVALAMIYAYTAFRVWLQGEEFEMPPDEDSYGFAGQAA